MITEKLTRETVERSIVHLDSKRWWSSGEAPQFHAFAENFFEYGYQAGHGGKCPRALTDILDALEKEARSSHDALVGAVMGKALLLTFERRQVVEDALSYLTCAARKGVKGAAAELCLWYAARVTANDLAKFPGDKVGLDDCYDPTPDDPRVLFPLTVAECRRRLVKTLPMTTADDFSRLRQAFAAITGSAFDLPADKAAADRLLAQLVDASCQSDSLAAAKRMIESEGKVAEGAKLVRELAEKGDYVEAWRYMLSCHEKGIGPFKTNKFRRDARAALARLEK